jgi:3-hydroxy-9,10-secoandrosta-1,3,5(10)-triene-9,17-dione monooxygenase reductase component
MSATFQRVTQDRVEELIEPQVFRRVLGHFLTGVAVIATLDAGQPVGLTVGSFFSVSLAPPLVGFCIAETSKTWPILKQAGRFCVSVLAADQEMVSRQFAVSGADKFEGLAWSLSDGGCPRLDDVIAWIDCDVAAIHVAGDHEICIGRVHALGDGRPAGPLPFFRGSHQLV